MNNTVKDITLAANAASSSTYPHLSCDGTTLVFSSPASNLVSGDTNGFSDIFVYNTYANTTERVSLSSSGGQATRDVETATSNSDVSYDGQYIVFYSDSNGLVGSDTNGYQDIYIINRKNSTIELLSMRNASTQTTGSSNLSTISADGRYVAYYSEDNGLVTGDTNSRPDMFVSETGL
jgi:Tol biopolymer transport system component